MPPERLERGWGRVFGRSRNGQAVHGREEKTGLFRSVGASLCSFWLLEREQALPGYPWPGGGLRASRDQLTPKCLPRALRS